jgi:hypothetical protein
MIDGPYLWLKGMTEFVSHGSNMDCHANDDGLRSWLTVDADNTWNTWMFPDSMPSANAVSVVSQIGLMVGSYHSVEQPVAFTTLDEGWRPA